VFVVVGFFFYLCFVFLWFFAFIFNYSATAKDLIGKIAHPAISEEYQHTIDFADTFNEKEFMPASVGKKAKK
jgi:hypothetical protein